MTSSQDPQFPSRRAARLNERANTTEAEAPVVENPQWNAQDGGQFVSPGATPPTAAAPEASTPPAVPTSLNPGRRAAPSAPDAEPLRRPRATAAPDDFPATQVMQKVDQPQYRYGDHRPETTSATPTPPAPAAPQWTEPYDVSVSAAPAAPQATEPPAAAAPPAAPEAPQSAVVPERTMTRRELRALQQQETEPPALQEPPTAALPLFSAPPRTPEELAAATTAFPGQPEPAVDAEPAREQQPSAAPAVPPTPAPDASLPTAWPFAASTAQPAAPVEPAQPVEPAPSASETSAPSATPAQEVFPTQAPEPLANTGLTNALAEFDLLTSGEPVAETPVESADDLSIFDIPLTPATPGQFTPEPPAQQASPETPPAWTPPKGHWSTQLDEEDGEVHETTINRTVGSGSVATSALVLPAIPESTISGPLPGSGEIILTGSITLPQTLGSSSASSKLEHSGIDQLFETHDAEVVSTESAPVSAVNAISTRSGSGLGNAPKQQSTRALTALIIAAAVMGVVVVGLLVTALALNVF
ncbi:hypothetical protein M2152_001392 [Microbacteriaceae bacterium SG_E_30_P1]|uniref:Meckel syndrome type 1 protein n=1 Tax=Antiquaquibacter oligotrophicus TaxID=2880260 RepID=A0ABT6KN70_9MICO|nr:hypothetical protein [Antiquaquibacter oligotrophicus]MDH6181210.1 hypothetical protein [Antiquaquibacter oligotrophicus]UDF13095.1 hypothetical protein LH407_13175 [Antiquaquibacter oligotrophicus]